MKDYIQVDLHKGPQYIQIPNKDGWVDARQYRPYPFDLVRLDYGSNRFKVGWWTGTDWGGATVKPDEHVFCWKRKEERELIKELLRK